MTHRGLLRIICTQPQANMCAQQLNECMYVSRALSKAFADHACSMADFVLDELLEAPVSSLSPSKAKHLRAPVEGKTGASPHQGIVLKMLGLKVSLCSCELIDTE